MNQVPTAVCHCLFVCVCGQSAASVMNQVPTAGDSVLADPVTASSPGVSIQGYPRHYWVCNNTLFSPLHWFVLNELGNGAAGHEIESEARVCKKWQEHVEILLSSL